jgi:hypothetical protein
LKNNFAIESGVIQASNNGYFVFTDSQIFNNIALSVAVGEIFDVSTNPIIDSCNIHHNYVIDEQQLLDELQSSCISL